MPLLTTNGFSSKSQPYERLSRNIAKIYKQSTLEKTAAIYN